MSPAVSAGLILAGRPFLICCLIVMLNIVNVKHFVKFLRGGGAWKIGGPF